MFTSQQRKSISVLCCEFAQTKNSETRLCMHVIKMGQLDSNCYLI